MIKFQIFHTSQLIRLHTQSFLSLYSFILGAEISLPRRFFMKSSSLCIDVSSIRCWQVLFLILFWTHNLSTLSLGRILWSICLSSLVHFKNGPEYLKRGTVPISLLKVSYYIVDWSLLVLPKYSFLKVFSLISTCLLCQLPVFPCICWLPFVLAILWLLDSVVRFDTSCVVSRFSLQACWIFYARFNLYILTVYSYSLYKIFQFFCIFGKKKKKKKKAGEEAKQQLRKNVASNIEKVLAETPHKAPTIRTPASHHENYPS